MVATRRVRRIQKVKNQEIIKENPSGHNRFGALSINDDSQENIPKDAAKKQPTHDAAHAVDVSNNNNNSKRLRKMSAGKQIVEKMVSISGTKQAPSKHVVAKNPSKKKTETIPT